MRAPRRSHHILTVRIDRELFEQVRDALALDHPPVRNRDEVAVGAWPALIEQCLIEWLAKNHSHIADRSPQ